MTENQCKALRLLQGGLRQFEGSWVWPVDIRTDPRLADRFMAKIISDVAMPECRAVAQ